MKLNSKWSYVASGANISLAFIGALWHSLPVLLMGAVFGLWNFYTAEFNRRLEDEQNRTETKE